MIKWFSNQIQLLMIVSAVFLINGCGSSSSSSTPPAPDTTAPTVPIYLTAVAASDTRVSLRWHASTDSVGVTAYTINRIDRNGSQLATTTTATTVYSDITCTANTAYTYSVAARDAVGNVSQFSSGAVTTTFLAGSADNAPPNVLPSALTASRLSSSEISLIWSPAQDNKGVSGYNIYRATASLGVYTKVGTTTTISFTDAGLTAGTTYYYVVKAFDGVPFESAASGEAFATP